MWLSDVILDSMIRLDWWTVLLAKKRHDVVGFSIQVAVFGGKNKKKQKKKDDVICQTDFEK